MSERNQVTGGTGPQSRRTHPSSAENFLQDQPFLRLPATELTQMPFLPNRQDHTGSNLWSVRSQRPAPDALEDDADEQEEPYDGQIGDSLISPATLHLNPKAL